MRFSVVTPSYNCSSFLEEAIRSVLQQREEGVELEYVVVDGGSTDGSHAILEKYRDQIDKVIIEKDTGPANAINKGFAVATGDVVSWLNADDLYYADALSRVQMVLENDGKAAFCFGRCPIIDGDGQEIRSFITRFKELFFPVSSEFLFQCINYISQPTLFFRRAAMQKAGRLREDMVAAWDYEFMLKLWHSGPGAVVPGGPVAAFRWHEQSISGQNYSTQFQEELDAVIAALGHWRPQVLLHRCVRLGIVGAYQGMAGYRRLLQAFER
jgi:glycosyltransferase involved in cell wall biosynthesis